MNMQALIKILACPKCKGNLELLKTPAGFACHQCDLVYPIKEDIPIMLIEEAIPLAEWQKKAE